MQILNSELLTPERLNPTQLNNELDSNLWPTFEQVSGDVPSLQFQLLINQALDYFAGHFPEQAVLPGVVQIHWAGELARRLFGCNGFCQLKSVKFNSVILPETRVNLSLDYNQQNGKLKFSYFNTEQRFSSGSMLFEAAQ
jgi:3-hydroxymyristoyl/3-hydroxydecanoyl-(acyl carrier protein) dehydratase